MAFLMSILRNPQIIEKYTNHGYDVHGCANTVSAGCAGIKEITGTNRTVFTYGDDLISQRSNNQTHFYHYDGLGSTRQLSNQSGSFTDSYDYQAFGEILNQTGTTQNNYLFTGEQFDQTLNQYYLRARYYNQQTGRFTQQDSWMGNSQDPITLHKYLYANVDPALMTDPSGNFATMGELMASMSNAFGSSLSTAVLRQSLKKVITASIAHAPQHYVKSMLKKCFRKPKECDSPVAILVTGQPLANTAAHIEHAQGINPRGIFMGRAPYILHRALPHNRSWLKSTGECRRPGVGRAAGLDCDEYPFASTVEGGRANYYRGRVSLKGILSTESPGQGGLISAFYSRCKIPRTASRNPSLIDPSTFVSLGLPSIPSFFVCRGK